MDERLVRLRVISNRLARALVLLVLVCIPGAILDYLQLGGTIITTPTVVFVVGVVGGFVGLQRRLKQLPDDDLILLANSWVYVYLSPLVGGILAVVLYVLFVSGLLAGDLFPKFVADADADRLKGLATLFGIHCQDPADYAKVLFWCFLAGFSERFVTGILGRFESQATCQDPPAG